MRIIARRGVKQDWNGTRRGNGEVRGNLLLSGQQTLDTGFGVSHVIMAGSMYALRQQHPQQDAQQQPGMLASKSMICGNNPVH